MARSYGNGRYHQKDPRFRGPRGIGGTTVRSQTIRTVGDADPYVLRSVVEVAPVVEPIVEETVYFYSPQDGYAGMYKVGFRGLTILYINFMSV